VVVKFHTTFNDSQGTAGIYVVAPGTRANRDVLTLGFCALLLAYGSGGLVAEWLAFWTQAQKGMGSNHSHDAVG